MKGGKGGNFKMDGQGGGGGTFNQGPLPFLATKGPLPSPCNQGKENLIVPTKRGAVLDSSIGEVGVLVKEVVREEGTVVDKFCSCV